MVLSECNVVSDVHWRREPRRDDDSAHYTLAEETDVKQLQYSAAQSSR